MFKHLTAACLSAALALPMTAAPVHANAEDVAKVLGGLTALYILKEALEDRRAAPVTRAAPVHQQPPRHQPVQRGHDHHRRDDHRHRDARVLPAECHYTLHTPRGWVSGYGARCLHRSVARPAALPGQCAQRVHTSRGWRTLYDARCLHRAGWSERRARR